MRHFKKYFNSFYYWFDSFRTSRLFTKIERFQLDGQLETIIVIYRTGNKRLLEKKPIFQFETENFDSCSQFDQHRLTKFFTIEKMLVKTNSSCPPYKKEILKFIKDEIQYDRSF